MLKTRSNGFKSMLSLRDDLHDLRAKGMVRGAYCGFEGLYPFYTMKPQGTTYVYGHPFAGKTLVWLELSINLTNLYGYRHAIFSPETGRPASIAAKLIAMWLKKPFYKELRNAATESDIEMAITHLNEYFFIADDTVEFSDLKNFYAYCDELEGVMDIKLNQTIIDPYNELENSFGGEARDVYTGKQLKECRLNAFKKNRHNTIITHCRDIQPMKGRDINNQEILFYPPPRPQEILNGQEFHRKGMMMVAIWRPQKGLVGLNGVPYKENETVFFVQKYKDEFTGNVGSFSMYYDKTTGRFYEEYEGNNRFANKKIDVLTQSDFKF